MNRGQLLTDDERDQLLRIPTDETTLYRLYTLPPDEVNYVRRALEPHTIMDRGLHLSLLKWPGTGFQLGQRIPPELAHFLAKQLKISIKSYRISGRVNQAHTRAARDAAGFFGMRTSTSDDYEAIVALAANEAAHTDSGWKIAEAMLKGLRSAKLVIPAWTTLDRAGLAGAARAKAQAVQTVVSAVTADQRRQLDRLLVTDTAIGQTRLAWLRNVKESARVSHLGHVIERREFLDGLGISTDIGSQITPWQLSRLVYRGNRARAQDIAEFADDHRHAVLATQVLHLHKVMSDGGVEMFNTLTAGIFSDAAELNEQRFMERKDDTVDLAKAFRGLVRAIRAATDDGVPLRAAVDSTVGWDTMLQLDGTADAFTTQTQQDALLTVCEQFGRLSTYVPKFLGTFTFTATNPKNPLLTAVSTPE